ncbi:ATP-binding cassette domain-containing protein [Actinomadura sp. LD22]|uniref:ATP-binding cassette domain-containing protein n=1 Tax=Actinomadura physcomitrii TaxID=2650748 RepID=A0A6I4MLM2_9ACTN|nr:ATP-binding cassette domain-containing protein [Actinomadura physcomitrii]
MLAVRDLVVRTETGTTVIDGVGLTVPRGGAVGLVGESGSGKSVTSLAAIGLLPDGLLAVSGAVEVDDVDQLSASADARRGTRGKKVAMIFQDPLAALNPRQRIGRQIDEILRVRDGLGRAEAARAAVELLRRVDMPDPEKRANDYPHQLSGGQRQRAMIALALAGRPELLLCDEPTTALDVTVQKHILHLLARVRAESGLALLLVSHDLRVISHVVTDLVVMYAGRIAETGPVRDLLSSPRHPYTAALVRNVPSPRARVALPAPLPGTPPEPSDRPGGCAFHPRCPLARDRCATDKPQLREIGTGRWSACHYAEEVRP